MIQDARRAVIYLSRTWARIRFDMNFCLFEFFFYFQVVYKLGPQQQKFKIVSFFYELMKRLWKKYIVLF